MIWDVHEFHDMDITYYYTQVKYNVYIRSFCWIEHIHMIFPMQCIVDVCLCIAYCKDLVKWCILEHSYYSLYTCYMVDILRMKIIKCLHDKAFRQFSLQWLHHNQPHEHFNRCFYFGLFWLRSIYTIFIQQISISFNSLFVQFNVFYVFLYVSGLYFGFYLMLLSSNITSNTFLFSVCCIAPHDINKQFDFKFVYDFW